MLEQLNGHLDPDLLQEKLHQLKNDVASFLYSCRPFDTPFGRFKSCGHAFVPFELDAATAGIEMWVMLNLPINAQELADAIRYLKSFQNPETGLVFDQSWKDRDIKDEPRSWEDGDTFFTMTTLEALKALGSRFDYPIRYLAEISSETLISNTNPQLSAGYPFAIGDYAALVAHNCALNIPGARDQWRNILSYLKSTQDSTTGLWSKGNVSSPYTPSINRTFHFLRSTWNMVDYPYFLAERMIDSCLDAFDAPQYYKKGDACNDLDLAHVIYGASSWSAYRSTDVKQWAAKRLVQILGMQRSDGGFSYKHETAMVVHNRISVSPGIYESDVWGTFMYMGTIKMMAELACPGVVVPWNYSQVHRIPRRYSSVQAQMMKIKERVGSKLHHVPSHFIPAPY